MYYSLEHLSAELIFIKWFEKPQSTCKPHNLFIDELRQCLDTSPLPLYFLSDLRLGRITDVRTIQKLGQLAKHHNYGGGVAFSQDTMSDIFVGMFSKFAGPERGDGVFFDTLPEALAQLESIKPGITQNIDWDQVASS